jgi:hypothetical protein
MRHISLSLSPVTNVDRGAPNTYLAVIPITGRPAAHLRALAMLVSGYVTKR